jgi:hypothetical protein
VTEPNQIEAAILTMTRAAGPDTSLCPSDVARALSAPAPSEEWRSRLSAVRRAAVRLAEAGEIDILRKGKPVDPATAKGVLRLRVRRPPPE